MEPNEAFRLFFKNLARQAPGTDEATLRALEACEELPDDPVVYDLGAGTGASTLVLAEELDSVVTAVDQMDESLEALQTRAERRGIDHLVRTSQADFSDLDIDPGSVDLIWSEGAIYIPGWEDGLRAWKPLLRAGGYLVVSDCVWQTDDPPAPAQQFWNAYPEMSSTKEHVDFARDEGLEVVDTFALPREAWADYYGPLRQRAGLVQGSDASEEMQAVARDVVEEVRVWEAHGEAFNYVFFVLRAT